MPIQFSLIAPKLSVTEFEFIDYFARISESCLAPVEELYRGVGPHGFGSSLLLARILKVKEGISSDRELCEKLKRIRLYRMVCRLPEDQTPAVSTFSEFRDRLGTCGLRLVHHRFVERAHSLGLLEPPLPGLPANRRPGIILIADSTFLLTAGSTTGEKQADGKWKFTDPTARFGRRHPHHAYAVGHRSHSLIAVSGIPLVSHVVSANHADVTQLPALLCHLQDRYPSLRFAYLLLDAGYDSEDAYRLTFEEFAIIPVILQAKEARAKKGFTVDWRPTCEFGVALRRTGIDYQRRRSK
jgi:IS5 family transposase